MSGRGGAGNIAVWIVAPVFAMAVVGCGIQSAKLPGEAIGEGKEGKPSENDDHAAGGNALQGVPNYRLGSTNPPSQGFPGVNGRVRVAIRDAVSPGCTARPNCIIIGGKFSVVKSTLASGIARLRPDGSVDSFGAGLDQGDSQILDLALDKDGNLYAAGSFSQISGVPVTSVAKWNGSQWASMGSIFDKIGSVIVTNVTIDPSGIPVASSSRMYEGPSNPFGSSVEYRVSKWNGSAWQPFIDSDKYKLGKAVLDRAGTLYAAGYVTDSSPWKPAVFKWTGSAWAMVGNAMGDHIYALLADPNGNLFVRLSTNLGVGYVRKWDGTGWGSTDGVGGTDDIGSLALDESGNLYAGRNGGVSKWNGTSWSEVGSMFTSFETMQESVGRVDTLVFDGAGNLYAGGVFDGVGVTGALNIARWNGTQWTGLGGGGIAKVSGKVAIGPEGALYASGVFFGENGERITGLARWDGKSWRSLGTVNPPGRVLALAVDRAGKLYAGGNFKFPGCVPHHGVAVWSGSDWRPLEVGLCSTVTTMNFDSSGSLWTGGDTVSRWDGREWTNVAKTGIFKRVIALEFDKSGILYAVDDRDADSEPFYARNELRKWDGTSWTPVLPEPIYYFFNLSLARDATGSLVVGGAIESWIGISKKLMFVSSWTGVKWTPKPEVGIPELLGTRIAIGSDAAGNIYAGGNFTSVYVPNKSQVELKGIAKWDGGMWQPLGAGINGSVSEFAVDAKGNIVVAGDFTTAGGKVRPSIAIWDAKAGEWR